jgi:hypothetical protein
MQNRVKFVLIASLLLTIAVLMLGAFNTRAQQKTAALIASQGQERIMVTKTHLNPPLKMKLLKTRKRVLERDKAFLDDDDWLRGLTVRLTNDSGKTVTFVSIELTFRRADDQGTGLPVGWPFEYGLDPFDSTEDPAPLPQFSPIPPGGDIEITLSDREYEELRSALREDQFPESIKKIELRVMKIGFNDDTAWNAGYMFRRDPKNMKGPLPGWTLIEETEAKPKVKEPSSSANRTAFFIKLTPADARRTSRTLGLGRVSCYARLKATHTL